MKYGNFHWPPGVAARHRKRLEGALHSNGNYWL